MDYKIFTFNSDGELLNTIEVNYNDGFVNYFLRSFNYSKLRIHRNFVVSDSRLREIQDKLAHCSYYDVEVYSNNELLSTFKNLTKSEYNIKYGLEILNLWKNKDGTYQVDDIGWFKNNLGGEN